MDFSQVYRASRDAQQGNDASPTHDANRVLLNTPERPQEAPTTAAARPLPPRPQQTGVHNTDPSEQPLRQQIVLPPPNLGRSSQDPNLAPQLNSPMPPSIPSPNTGQQLEANMHSTPSTPLRQVRLAPPNFGTLPPEKANDAARLQTPQHATTSSLPQAIQVSRHEQTHPSQLLNVASSLPPQLPSHGSAHNHGTQLPHVNTSVSTLLNNLPPPSQPQQPPSAAAAASVPMTDAMKQRLWAASDAGQKALSSLHGSTTRIADSASLIMIVTALLPVNIFAPDYSMWKNMPTATIPVFVMTMKSYLPDLFAQICAVTTMQGSECKTALQSVTAALFGTFGERVHSAFLYAVMLYIWCSNDSHKSDLVFSILMEYMASPDANLQRVLTNAKSAYTTGVSAAVMATQFTYASMSVTPGYRRLDYKMAIDTFTNEWHFLWECACASMAQSVTTTTPAQALQHISVTHFKAQTMNESMQQFFSRLLSAYRLSMAQLVDINRSELLPHPNGLVDVIYQSALPQYTAKVKSMLKTTEDYDDAQLTFDVVRDLYLKAAKLSAREFQSIDAAIEYTHMHAYT